MIMLMKVQTLNGLILRRLNLQISKASVKILSLSCVRRQMFEISKCSKVKSRVYRYR